MTTSTRRSKRGKKDSRNDAAAATSDNDVAITTTANNAVVVVNDENNLEDNNNNDEGDPVEVEVEVRVEVEVEAPINEQQAVDGNNDNNEKKKRTSSAETTQAEAVAAAAVVNLDNNDNEEDDAVVPVSSNNKSSSSSFLGGTVLERDTVGLGLRYKTEKEREKVHENDILFSSVDLGLRSGSGSGRSSSTKFLNHTDHSGNKTLQSIIKARKSNYFVNDVTNIDSCSIAVNEEERTKIAKEIFHEITTTPGVGVSVGVGRFLNFKSMNKAKYENMGIDFVWEIMDEITSIIKICQNINYIFMSDNERNERNLAIEIQQKQQQNDYRNERKQKNGKTVSSSDKKSKTNKSTKQSKILLQQRQQEQEQRENAQIQEQQQLQQQQQQQQCQQVQMRIYQLQQQQQQLQQVYYPPTPLIQQFPTTMPIPSSLSSPSPLLPKDGKKKTKGEKRKAPVTAAMANERTGIIDGRVIVDSTGGGNSENKNNDIVQEHDIVLFDSIEAGRKKENVNDNDNDDHDDTNIDTKYCIVNDKGHYQEHIGNENLVKLIVKKKSDYDYIEGQDIKKLGIARIRQNISLNIVNFIVQENGGRFLFCSKKDVDVDVGLLETPTAEATIAIIKDGEDAIARAEAALRGEKTPTKTSNDIEDEDEDIRNEDSGPVVWEELKDEIMIQAIVWRCMKDIYKLADENKKKILENRKEAKKERKRLREEQRQQQQQQEQEQEQFQVQLRQQQQQQHEQFQQQQQMNMIMMMNQQAQQQQQQQPQYYNPPHQDQNGVLTGGTPSKYQKKRKQQAVEEDPSGRKNKSCDFCRDKKLKCNRTSPCENCTTKYMKDHNMTRIEGIDDSKFNCVYSNSMKRGPVRKSKSPKLPKVLMR